MTLYAIHGKPGSGKSCYCVSLIVKQLSDWAVYDRDNDEPYPRILYTNIPLYVEKINEYLSKELGFKVDVSSHIEVLNDFFFRDEKGEYKKWWEEFPDGAYIVIDEVHHYLPASIKKKKGGGDYADEFTNYVSMHRHRQHDIILLSQHIDNVSVEVKKQIQTIYEVLNVKNQTIGIFPFTVSMADVDVVREAWGFPVQLAHIKKGVCESRSVKYEKEFQAFILTPSLFSLYRSHTKSDEALDRPSLKLGKVGSVVWFARRYLFKFVFSICLIISLVMAARNMFTELPNAMVKGLTSNIKIEEKNKPFPTAAPVSVPIPLSVTENMPVADNTPTPVIADDVISGFIKNGVITPKGVLRVGDTLRHGGVDEKITRVNFMESKIEFESGKKYKK